MHKPTIEITFRLVEVTPTLAKEWLRSTQGQRDISPAFVKSYKKDILSGNFETTHQAIALNMYGILIDGQHRLTAIVESGVSVWMYVATYQDGRTALHLPIDTGKPRSFADVNQIPHNLVSIVNQVIRLTYGESSRNNSYRLPVCNEIIAEFDEAYTQAYGGMSLSDSTTGKPDSNVGVKTALLAALIDGKKELAKTMFGELQNCATKNEDVIAFRNHFNAVKGKRVGGSTAQWITYSFWGVLTGKGFVEFEETAQLVLFQREVQTILQDWFFSLNLKSA